MGASMVRGFTQRDIDAVMEIWLEANISAHPFIPALYWKSKYGEVRALIPHATVFVYEEGFNIYGFMGLTDTYIAGIFVKQSAQSQGIGKKLVEYAKKKYIVLSLHVYAKNIRAVKFYKREDFCITHEQIDPATGEAEYAMEWKK